MILETMTRQEVLKELQADCDWVDERIPGLKKKYNKSLKNKRVGHKTILGISKYLTPRKNKVFVCAVKLLFRNYCALGNAVLFEFVGNDGKIRYIFPLFEDNRLVETITFSSHCIKRMKERSGLQPIDVLKIIAIDNEGSLCFSHYEYEGKLSFMSPLGNIGGVIGVKCDWGILAITYINVELQGENQLTCLQNGKEKNSECFESVIDSAHNLIDGAPRAFRRMHAA